MTSSRRWKLLCGMLAVLTVYSWMRDPTSDHARAASARSRMVGHRPVRVSAAALGVSMQEIIDGLLTSPSNPEMRRLAEQLGAVGDDAAIDAVLRLVADPRPGVPEMILAAIGAIGTDHAVAVLIDFADDARSYVQLSAIYALGSTGNERAETFLVGLARRDNTTAITALGQLASDRAVDVLYRIGSAGGDEAARLAISTLGGIGTSAATAALGRLIDSPSLETASAALGAIQNVDDAMLAKLTAIVKAGEVQLVTPAALAIAHAGEVAIPLLSVLALSAPTSEVRVAAVQALGTIRSSAVVETLGGLIENGEDEVAKHAAQSLAQFESPEARDVLMSAALSDRAEATQAIEALVSMQGEDVDHVLFEIVRTEHYGAERALGRLLSHDHTEALDLVIARTATGTTDDRLAAMTLLADANTDTTAAALLDAVRGEHGELKTRAIELVIKNRPSDPDVTKILRDSLHAEDGDEKRAAAAALGRVGTDEARDALVAALASGDSDVSHTALGALSAYRLDDAACSAIHSAAVVDTALVPEAMRKLLAAGSPAGLRLAESSLTGDAGTAVRTLQYLTESNTPGAVELVARSMRASDDYVRTHAVRAIGAMRPSNAVELVADALRDASPSVRGTAASTLSSLGGERARDALLNLTHSADAGDRVTALHYLPDDLTSLGRARELLRDSDSNVSYTAMRSLAASQDGAAMLRAFVLDRSRDDDTRYNAAAMLENYGRLDDATSAFLAAVRAEYHASYDDE